MDQAMQGPYVNGVPDKAPDGYPIPLIQIEVNHTVPMSVVQELIHRTRKTMRDLGFGEISPIRIETGFLQLVDPDAPDYNNLP